MDPVTHGLTGALLGKAYFSEKQGRVAAVAATLGSIFPDIDIIAEPFGGRMAIIKIHRGFTHSFLGMPVFAAMLAGLTIWWQRRRGKACPSWLALFIAYSVGIASHILLDGMTTFGTRILNPLSTRRYAWDFLFIIDLSLTAVVLIPQLMAWVYRNRQQTRRRATRIWILLTAGAILVWQLAATVGFPFSPWTIVAWSTGLAALFFLPSAVDGSFSVRRSAWCRAGVYATVIYVAACGWAHHAALERVQNYAGARGLPVERIAAMPLPASFLSWGGLILTPEGVYQAAFRLDEPPATGYRLFASAPANQWTQAAEELQSVRLYLWFARFPVVRYRDYGDEHIVQFYDVRFFGTRNRRTMPFLYEVVFNASGRVVREGWVMQPSGS